MRIAFIGCVQFSYHTLEHLLSLNHPEFEIVGIITRDKSPINADFSSLAPLAIKKNIPYYITNKNEQSDTYTWLKKLSPDLIYCFGWSYLLKEPILNLPRLGVVGYHPADLPQNRGRHPIIWALALGLKQTASTFFFMDEGTDSGDILSQKFLSIEYSDDASSLYSKLTEMACEQIAELTTQLTGGTYKRSIQDHSKANYWRKRGKSDGMIDWRMCAVNIHNLVRALTRPYLGACFSFNNKNFRIWRSEAMDEPSALKNMEPGKIIDISGQQIIVKSGNGLLKMVEHDFDLLVKVGDYL